MNIVTFSTNLKCSGCVAKITPALNSLAGAGNWAVNLDNADKVLTVNVPDNRANDIINAVKEAGYTAIKQA